MATKTKDLIIDSFLQLADKTDKDIEKISITDIVEECQISRQTFYYHFKDIDEMLKWAFENETATIKKNMHKYNTWQEALILYENIFKKYGNLLKKCLNSKYFVYVYSLLRNSIHDFSKEFFALKNKARFDEHVEFAINVYSYALIGFIIRELKKDEPDFYYMIQEINHNLSSAQ